MGLATAETMRYKDPMLMLEPLGPGSAAPLDVSVGDRYLETVAMSPDWANVYIWRNLGKEPEEAE